MIATTACIRGGVQLLRYSRVRLRLEVGAGGSLQSQTIPRGDWGRLSLHFMATKSVKKRQQWRTVQQDDPQKVVVAETTGAPLEKPLPELKKPAGLAKVETKIVEKKPEAKPEAVKPPTPGGGSRYLAGSSPRMWVPKSPTPAVQTPPKAVHTPSTPRTLSHDAKLGTDAVKGTTSVSDRPAPKQADKNLKQSDKQQNKDSGENKKAAVAQALLRATFYPKFENEKSDQEVRSRVIEVVSAGEGVLEVSLKHSGSLFMYSGDKGGAYAKNSYGNLYTATGVFVLGRTIQEAWGPQAAKKQQEFNRYLEENRISIAMELVTAVLGDHGQRPLKDYVVVTAVTDLTGQPRFFSAPDVVAFCRRWRLPTNHFWLFSSKKSVSAFFTAYDALCEEGLATSVSRTLDEISDASVPATKPHQDVQGEILEGLVARVVSPDALVHMKETSQDLPPAQGPEGPAPQVGLREIFAANKISEKDQIKAVLAAVGSDFCPDRSQWLNEEDGTVHTVKKAETTALSTFLQAQPADKVTAKVQEVIRFLRKRNMHVRFKCSHHSGQKGDDAFRLTIHVLSDAVFRRYQNELKKHANLWPLYRGFFLDVRFCGSDVTPYSADEGDVKAITDVEQTGTTENLMLKLKFLPYKLRTFLIRNGLSTLYSKGPASYREYYTKQMKNWGTSVEKRKDVSELLNEWANYITAKTGGKQLSSDTYLSEAEPFLEAFARRSVKNKQLVGSAGSVVHVEDFLAAERSSEDELGEVLDDNTSALSAPQPEEQLKAKGLLVFFPGIPGCAKSALCQQVMSHNRNGFGDGRKTATLMGDLIKGRYWQRLAADQKKNPNTIMLADKNAPNDDVWKQIETICENTQALGVPVVSESEGTSSNPYGIDDLAVFSYRVLQRVNHPGNLDKNSPTPGYVLLMFYHLYEGTDRKDFEATLLGKHGHLIKLPLLKKERAPLPTDVSNVIKDGIALFKRHKSKHGKLDALQGSFKSDWVAWEKRLKETLFANAAHLDAIQVPFEEVANSFVVQLKEVATGDNLMHVAVAEEERNFNNVTFAAIALPQEEIVAALNSLSLADTAVQEYLSDKAIEKSLQRAHITLAHKRAHGVAAVASYGDVRGVNVPVELTAMLFSDKLCAIEANLKCAPDRAVLSRNEWPHITVWTDKGVAAKEANSLPSLVDAGKAHRFQFPTPKTVVGNVQFL